MRLEGCLIHACPHACDRLTQGSCMPHSYLTECKRIGCAELGPYLCLPQVRTMQDGQHEGNSMKDQRTSPTKQKLFQALTKAVAVQPGGSGRHSVWQPRASFVGSPEARCEQSKGVPGSMTGMMQALGICSGNGGPAVHEVLYITAVGHSSNSLDHGLLLNAATGAPVRVIICPASGSQGVGHACCWSARVEAALHRTLNSDPSCSVGHCAWLSVITKAMLRARGYSGTLRRPTCRWLVHPGAWAVAVLMVGQALHTSTVT
jgi:hypothetical protein